MDTKLYEEFETQSITSAEFKKLIKETEVKALAEQEKAKTYEEAAKKAFNEYLTSLRMLYVVEHGINEIVKEFYADLQKVKTENGLTDNFYSPYGLVNSIRVANKSIDYQNPNWKQYLFDL